MSIETENTSINTDRTARSSMSAYEKSLCEVERENTENVGWHRKCVSSSLNAFFLG